MEQSFYQFSRPDLLKLLGVQEGRGKGKVAIVMCHQVRGNGVVFGPALEVVTKNGERIQGLALSAKTTHILKVIGGDEVTRKRQDGHN